MVGATPVAWLAASRHSPSVRTKTCIQRTSRVPPAPSLRAIGLRPVRIAVSGCRTRMVSYSTRASSITGSPAKSETTRASRPSTLPVVWVWVKSAA